MLTSANYVDAYTSNMPVHVLFRGECGIGGSVCCPWSISAGEHQYHRSTKFIDLDTRLEQQAGVAKKYERKFA